MRSRNTTEQVWGERDSPYSDPWSERYSSSQIPQGRVSSRSSSASSISDRGEETSEESDPLSSSYVQKICSYETRFINLRKRRKRCAKMEGRFKEIGIHATRFEARTGDDAPESVVLFEWDTRLNALYDKTTLPHPRVPLTKGERGCAMSHACLWSMCASSHREEPMLILEDDVQFIPNFKFYLDAVLTRLNTAYLTKIHPSQHRLILYLGADVASFSPPYHTIQHKLWLRSLSHTLFTTNDTPLEEEFSQNEHVALRLVSADYVWQTSSYIIWPAAARALLAELPMREPVDNFISRQILERRLQALILLPNLCKQVNAYNDGDILHSRPAIAAAPHATASDVPLAPIIK